MFFCFNDTASTEIYTLSLHDALPICKAKPEDVWSVEKGIIICKGKPNGYIITEKEYGDYVLELEWRWPEGSKGGKDRKSTRLNSSHANISYAVFCLKKNIYT